MSLTQDPTIGTLWEFPRTCTPLAAVTQTADTWDSGVGAKYVTLTADSVRVDVYVSKDARLVFTSTTAAPAQDGALFLAGLHSFRVNAPGYLHIKNGTAGQNVAASVTCWTQ